MSLPIGTLLLVASVWTSGTSSGLSAEQIFIIASGDNSDLSDLSSDDECNDPTFNIEYDHCDILESEENVNDDIVDDVNDRNDASTSKTNQRALTWKRKKFDEKPHPEVHNNPQRQNDMPVRTPFEYFSDYFDDAFFENAAEKTNMYSILKTGKSISTTAAELKIFFGINLFMGVITYPRLPMYWQKGIELNLAKHAMTRDRFLALRMNFHVVDTVTPPANSDTNSLWKIQPMIDAVRNRCLLLPRTYHFYSIDEQMIPFTGRCNMKQYVKNKPRPAGLKNFALTSSSGTVLDFEIYQGEKTPLGDRRLGLGPAVVLRLARSLPPLESFLYFDRYFNTLPLLEALADIGIEGSGTIMTNRLKGITLNKNKMSRGESVEHVRSDGKVVVTEWMDNQKVVMASTCSGIYPESKVKRWSKVQKKFIEVNCPAVVARYNKSMGGVDVCNQLIELYRIWFKTRKWTLKVILHLLNLAAVNSWNTYREDSEANAKGRRQTHDLLNFQMELAEALIATPRTARIEVSEDDEIETPPPKKQKNYTPSPIPGVDKRYDGYSHWPCFDEIKSPRICRLEKCTSRTKIRCEKCDVYLCLSREKNCFKLFHIKP